MDAAAWDDRYTTAEPNGTAEPNRFVAAILGDVPPGTALDLGAGTGRNAIWLAERGWRVRAVDFSAVALERTHRTARRSGVSVETELADVTTYEPDPQSWDLVLMSYLQLPTDQRHQLLDRASHWVAAGGLLLVIAHDRANIDGGHGGPRSEEVSYTPDDTVAALDGLTIRRAATVERPVATDDGERVALDTLVLAARPSTKG
jgi:SAM-dependent methyltransferase